ncbi:Glucose-6-phosphate isomerase [Mesomycoplasma conjunctivae]|uniref:glucose-6-phosphate isomerase n=1 Tax=Mesomycoplasma conjunctivae TaxID=45361 RepID=UPI0002DAB00C|nr:glucose-6-phosphate isomerase [Mesomycoplasma conjunctivae]VEU66623.1 Glucose-6-phosphate isomerase [Mesomycoplasma conjunctivae]
MNLKLKIESSQFLQINSYSEEVAQIHRDMNALKKPGYQFLGWKDFPENALNEHELEKMKQIAKKLKQQKVEVLVVIGIGGSFLGAKAGIDFIQGLHPIKRDMEIIFVGTSISSTDLYQKLQYVATKKFAINVISKSGTTIEPSIAFRLFKNLLETQQESKAKNFIFVTTDANKGTLLSIAEQKGYEKFVVLDNIGGRFSVLSSVGFFPMICAGVNIDEVIRGATEANIVFSQESLDLNPAYQYAVARYILFKKLNYKTEILIGYEPFLTFFNEWWKQLFGESEGKNKTGLWPSSAIFTTDLHSLGQFIQEGSRIFFETVIFIKEPKYDIQLEEELGNLDGLNYLAKKTVHEINYSAFQATLAAHVHNGQTPNIVISLNNSSARSFGWLVMFFEKACAMSAYLLGLNPFDQPGVEVYKENLKQILKK